MPTPVFPIAPGNGTPPLPPSRQRRPLAALFRRLSSWQKFALGASLVPAVITGGGAGAYYYELHQLSAAMTLQGLPIAPTPNAERRILVLSPHCDDETLGAGGYIADARKQGAQVTVAFLTNGDGFRVAASRTLHEVNVGPADFVRFAEVRQNEAVAALGEEGIAPQNVVFMGYPDRGLRPMWEDNWDASHPFRSGFTGHTHSPYARTFTPHALYCGSQVVSDLVRLMKQVRPTDILVTHPADDHPDHNAAPAFAQAAVRVCEGEGNPWASGVRIHYYIVHRGDWPLPQGLHPDRPLLPPPGLVTRDARWSVYAATSGARQDKSRALDRYVSQMDVSRRFLTSFQRTNELFTDLPTPVVHFSGSMTGSRQAASCETASARFKGDSLVRYVESGGDLKALSVELTDSQSVRIRLSTRGPVSPRLSYRLLLRGAQTTTGGTIDTRFTSQEIRPTVAERGGTVLEATIPLSRVGLDKPGHAACLWVGAESRWANRLPVIDRTGYRPFLMPNRDSEPGTNDGFPETMIQKAGSYGKISRNNPQIRPRSHVPPGTGILL